MQRFRFFVLCVLAILASLRAVAVAQASVSVKVCNEATTGVWIGLGYYVDETVKWVTSGWWWADPKECTEPINLYADARELYVYANTQGDDVEWQGTKSLCVAMDSAFQYDDAEKLDCTTKRPFKKYVPDASGNLTVTLRDDEAARVAYNLTLCNKTNDGVSFSLGNAPETGEGVSSDGWYHLDTGQCQTYIRRGKYRYAYLYAQAPGRRLVWHGNVALCTRYHDGFALAGADSVACQDGDSERLPFIKISLGKGVTSYDLTAPAAHAFKSGLNLCNGHKDAIYPAIAHLDGIGTNGLVARGFWLLHPGECRLLDAVAASPVYLYAETDAGDKTWGGNDLKGCVRNQGFTFPGVERYACNREGERSVGFLKWNVSEGANVYKFE